MLKTITKTFSVKMLKTFTKTFFVNILQKIIIHLIAPKQPYMKQYVNKKQFYSVFSVGG